MSLYIKYILSFAFFILVFANIQNALQQSHQYENENTDDMAVNLGMDSHHSHVSVALDLSIEDFSCNPIYEKSGTSEAWDVCRAIFFQPTFLIGTDFYKFYKIHFIAQGSCALDPLLTQINVISSSGNTFIRSTSQYYIYTLRHILI